MRRVKISVYVDECIWREFKAFVMKEHGKLHRVLGEEVERALEERLARNRTSGNAEVQLFRILKAIDELNKAVDSVILEQYA